MNVHIIEYGNLILTSDIYKNRQKRTSNEISANPKFLKRWDDGLQFFNFI